MGISMSLFLIAAGAIMRYAVTVEGEGFNIGTAGMVLMIVGTVGAVISIVFWASWGGVGRRSPAGPGATIVRERETIEGD